MTVEHSPTLATEIWSDRKTRWLHGGADIEPAAQRADARHDDDHPPTSETLPPQRWPRVFPGL